VPDKPSLAHEFRTEQSIAHALAGTVALPSPFPASARIYVGIRPGHNPAGAGRYYLKLVEAVSDKLVVTRLVSLEDARAVRFRPESGRPADLWDWTLYTADDLHDELEYAKAALSQAAAAQPGAHELPLVPEKGPKGPDATPPDRAGQPPTAGKPAGAARQPQGIVYVPESAPVLVRVEYGVVAAEAATVYPPILLHGRCCADKPFYPPT
jgi:hypothetical protein